MEDLRTLNVVELRTVSNNLEYDGEQAKLVREAAKAILAENLSPDEGTYVSHKSLSALIHYIADMIE